MNRTPKMSSADISSKAKRGLSKGCRTERSKLKPSTHSLVSVEACRGKFAVWRGENAGCGLDLRRCTLIPTVVGKIAEHSTYQPKVPDCVTYQVGTVIGPQMLSADNFCVVYAEQEKVKSPYACMHLYARTRTEFPKKIENWACERPQTHARYAETKTANDRMDKIRYTLADSSQNQLRDVRVANSMAPGVWFATTFVLDFSIYTQIKCIRPAKVVRHTSYLVHDLG